MPTFRKTALIDAVQWTGENWEEIKAFAGDAVRSHHLVGDLMQVHTREGWTKCLTTGYWIATDGKSFWPVADDFMQANYEEVADGD